MFTVLTQVHVKEYAKWRPVFDEMKTLRDARGLESERVYRSAANPNEVFIEMNFRKAAGAHEYTALPEVRTAMQRAGVVAAPEINFLEPAPDAVALDASTKVVNQVVAAIEAQDWKGARALLADDFKFSGAVPQPISGDEWLGIHRGLAAAMPDLRLNYAPSKSNGAHTSGTVKITGTHTGEFNLPIPGIPHVAPTGNQIANPIEHVEVTVRNGKLAEWNVERVPDGGMLGIIGQMGVTMPKK